MIGLLLVLCVLSIVLFVNFHPAFGGTPQKELYKNSKNFDGKKFVNLLPTAVSTPQPNSKNSMLGALKNMLMPPTGKTPKEKIPAAQFHKDSLTTNSFVWFGHSSVLMNLDDTFVLADPVFHNASPLPGTVTPFETERAFTLDSLPQKIDIVIISHDHYDHLDYKTIKKIKSRVANFLVPLGIKAHLLRWGVDARKITEQDWGESTTYKSIQFTTTPARHFSGRGITNRYSTLWCSWVIKSTELNIFFNGDSGYFNGFEKIGNQYGPFDIAFIENGAYDENWNEIHMFPEESVQAAIDLNAKTMFPIHWGKFDLANHNWKDPIERTIKAAKNKNITVVNPMIFENFNLENIPQKHWWETIN